MKCIRWISDPQTVATIAALDSGWHSAANASWKAGGESFEGRSRVKAALGELAKAGEIERIYVEHCDRPLLCYKLDGPRLTALVAEYER
jgi:hypothetical protein